MWFFRLDSGTILVIHISKLCVATKYLDQSFGALHWMGRLVLNGEVTAT